jgi:hypothetical protein
LHQNIPNLQVGQIHLYHIGFHVSMSTHAS